MRQTWRWFGPQDRTTIDEIRQCGVEGIVTALHHVAPGTAWPPEAIAQRQAEVATLPDGRPSGLAWEVVESIPVTEEIKQRRGDFAAHTAAWIESLRHVAAAGIQTVCYNFMPVLDWTRTDLVAPTPAGTRCMRYDHVDFALFDADMLERPGASDDWDDDLARAVEARRKITDPAHLDGIARAILCGLPGETSVPKPADVRARLAEYDGITADDLRVNFAAFLEQVVPVAEDLGVRLCCHPDDPPFSLLGLPRIMSTEADYRWLIDTVDSPANGITLCAGSLGARGDADVPGLMRRLGHRVHFLHLRNVTRDSDALFGSFEESDHLDGHVDMVALVDAVLHEEARRRAEGRSDWEIPMRPDHGRDMLGDADRQAQPGYPLIGRMRGLAELRGVAQGLARGMASAQKVAAE